MTCMRTLLVWFLLIVPAWAQDLVVCDPTHPLVPNAVTRYERTGDWNALVGRSGFLVWDAPNVSHTPEQVAAFNQLRSQLDSLAGVPHRYWTCADLTVPADGLLESVVEMTQAQKDAVDAPARQQAAVAKALADEEAALDALAADWETLTAMQKTEAFRRQWRVRSLRRSLSLE